MTVKTDKLAANLRARRRPAAEAFIQAATEPEPIEKKEKAKEPETQDETQNATQTKRKTSKTKKQDATPEAETKPQEQTKRKKKRSGRPAAPPEKKKSAQILTPMTEKERERVDELAYISRRSSAEIVRAALKEYWEKHKSELDQQTRERLDD